MKQTKTTQPVQSAADLQAGYLAAIELFWTDGKFKSGIKLCRNTLGAQRELPGLERLPYMANSVCALAQMFLELAQRGRKTKRTVRLGFACKFYAEALVMLEQLGADKEDLALHYSGAAQAFAQSGKFFQAYILLDKAFTALLPAGNVHLNRDRACYLAGQCDLLCQQGKRCQAMDQFAFQRRMFERVMQEQA